MGGGGGGGSFYCKNVQLPYLSEASKGFTAPLLQRWTPWGSDLPQLLGTDTWNCCPPRLKDLRLLSGDIFIE